MSLKCAQFQWKRGTPDCQMFRGWEARFVSSAWSRHVLKWLRQDEKKVIINIVRHRVCYLIIEALMTCNEWSGNFIYTNGPPVSPTVLTLTQSTGYMIQCSITPAAAPASMCVTIVLEAGRLSYSSSPIVSRNSMMTLIKYLLLNPNHYGSLFVTSVGAYIMIIVGETWTSIRTP